MKLHWSPRSPYVRKVLVCAHELGLAESIELVHSTVAMSKPNREVMRDNPLGKIPTLVIGEGRSLFDSPVICEYLDSLHQGERLFAQPGPRRWEALRWHALGDGMLDILVLWRNERLRRPAQQSAELLAAFEMKIRGALDVLQREAEALRSAAFGIGHVGVGCALGYLDFRFPELGWRQGRSALCAWFETLAQRVSFQRTLPVDQ